MIVGVGDRDSERGAKAYAVFGAFDSVIDRSVHETPPGLCEACRILGLGDQLTMRSWRLCAG